MVFLDPRRYTPTPGPGPVGRAMGLSAPAAPARPPANNLVMRDSPRATQAPAPSTGGSRNTQAPQAPTVTQPRRPEIPDFRDSAYNAQIASLDRALRDFETGATTRGERYGQDFMTGLGRLGYRPGGDFQAMPNIVEALNQPQAMARGMSEGAPGVSVAPVTGGQFDIEGEMDRTSAAARGTRGMRDEFAGRGTLRSSDFAKSFGDFQSRLNEQLQAMETGRGRFAEDLATELSQFRARTGEQKAAAEESARNRAIMQAISQMGF